MVTDRCTTSGLLVYIAHQNPSFLFLIQFLIALDLSSHYSVMMSSLTLGSSSHKKVNPSTPFLLRLYYQNSIVLFLVCAGNELFFMTWYLSSTGLLTTGLLNQQFIWTLSLLSFPICFFKQVLNVVQLVGSSQDLVQADRQSKRKGKERVQ